MIYKRFTSGTIASNTYLLADQKTKETVIIDPGYTQEELDLFVEEEGLKPTTIINTHGHADHIHNNAYFKDKYGCKILVHKADASRLTDPADNLSEYLGYQLSSPPADGFLEEADEVSFGSQTLKVLHTPGHSPGSISLLYKKSVFVGDLIFNGSVGRTDLVGGDPDQLTASIRDKILPLDDETIIYSGHGTSPMTLGQQRQVNPFLQAIEETMEKEIQED